MENSRRDFLLKSAALALGTIAGKTILGNTLSSSEFLEKEISYFDSDLFTKESLPYAYDALEPHIDKLTMEIHHSKHFWGYIDKLNDAIKTVDPTILNGNRSLNNIFLNVAKLPAAVRNNAGGVHNHFMYFALMKPMGAKEPIGKLSDAIKASFGSLDEFKKQFADAGMKRFGSGWAWLVKTKEGKLVITSTANQDNPLMNLDSVEVKGTPIIGMDIWEHAYYLKNQNRRVEYITSWWNVLNWDVAEKNYTDAI